MALQVAHGNIHQGSESFSETTRGRQCSFMALTAIIFHDHHKSIQTWGTPEIDEILMLGNHLFSDALQNDFIPNASTLTIEDLPNLVRFNLNFTNSFKFFWTSQSNCIPKLMPVTNGNSPATESEMPILATTDSEMPLVATDSEMPLVATDSEMPIVATDSEMPIVATNSEMPLVATNSEMPLVATNSEVPVVANHSENSEMPLATKVNEETPNRKYNFIKYGQAFQGLFYPKDYLHGEGEPFLTLDLALINVFSISNYAVMILDGYMISFIKDSDIFYSYDSHARNCHGLPDENGNSVAMSHLNIETLMQYLCILSESLNVSVFEVVSVELFHSQSVEYRIPVLNDKSRTNMSHSNIEFYGNNYNSFKRTQCSVDDLTESNINPKKLKQTKQFDLNPTKEGKKKIESAFLRKQREQQREKKNYLNTFNLSNGRICEQSWAKKNIDKFHNSLKFSINQCPICLEVWPVKFARVKLSKEMCLRCKKDKKLPKKISKGNNMIPSAVPLALQGLTQIEEMLIARALPIMRVYVRPGGQRGYVGHCINLPQKVKELATSLPRYPKDLKILVVQMKGKNNTHKDLHVRRNKVHSALMWLFKNNPLYTNLEINTGALHSLPENGVPSDLLTVETDDSIDSNDLINSHVVESESEKEDLLYDDSTEISTLLPVCMEQEKEIDTIRSELLGSNSMEWPVDENAEPLNEYNTPFLATMAFPTLFPDGKGDPTNVELVRDIPMQEKIKHLVKYGELLHDQFFYRFASHPRFAYWALNMIQRNRILQQCGIFLKQNPGEAHLSFEELQEMAQNNSSKELMTKVSRYVGNITGSNGYWHKVREELKAIILTKGSPTIFFTFSSADMHWPELHDLFAIEDIVFSSSQRRQNVINNPHIVDWFFTKRLENFVKHWLYDTLDADWHWYRFEYQHRGSIHCHGTAKLKNDPGLCELTEIALKGFLVEKTKHEQLFLNDQQVIQCNVDINNGRNAELKICQYIDWLMSTMNPVPQDTEQWIKPNVHPCQKRHPIPEHMKQSDYADLVNTVQRHSKCNPSYCLRKKNGSEMTCRFHFPFQHAKSTRLEFEEVHSKNGTSNFKAKIVTKRNDSRVNNHQQCQLQGWRGNCDIQPVLDHYACVEYLTKYAAKGEPRSAVINKLFNSVVQNANESSETKSIIKKIAMKSLGERDFAAQETMHHLLSLKQHSSSFKVVPVSLSGSRKLRKISFCDDESDIDTVNNCTDNCLMDMYAKRMDLDDSPEFLAMNFVQFATKYTVFKNTLTKLSENAIPRFFPTYSPNPNGPNYPLYCKFQLLRYKPWKKLTG